MSRRTKTVLFSMIVLAFIVFGFTHLKFKSSSPGQSETINTAPINSNYDELAGRVVSIESHDIIMRDRNGTLIDVKIDIPHKIIIQDQNGNPISTSVSDR